MPFDPKPISIDSVPAALDKAHRYRLLNEPSAAESICLDVLAVDADNQQALETLLLAITDQFEHEHGAGVRRARELLPRFDDEYRRQYYAGIICERAAMTQLHRLSHGSAHGAGEQAYTSIRDAMERYERAEALRPAGNDEAILRWNTCARILARYPALHAPEAAAYEPSFD
ncbi:MAG: hypothetical protein JO180_01805 [Gemmatirosa sp.]|nr:hypothetical protein [Gemmatirosa sp.]